MTTTFIISLIVFFLLIAGLLGFIISIIIAGIYTQYGNECSEIEQNCEKNYLKKIRIALILFGVFISMFIVGVGLMFIYF